MESEREGDAPGDSSMCMSVSLGWSGFCSPGDLCISVRLRGRRPWRVSEPSRQPSLTPLALLLELLALLLELPALLLELLTAQIVELLLR